MKVLRRCHGAALVAPWRPSPFAASGAPRCAIRSVATHALAASGAAEGGTSSSLEDCTLKGRHIF